MRKLKVVGIDIFLEKRKTRMHVGALTRENGKIMFVYNERYFTAKYVIPLGPEFPLTQRKFFSEKLFPSLEDRIPSRKNPAYVEYCAQTGIDPKEQDPFILLSTIGKRGPSSFVCSALYDREITPEDLIEFRDSLGLTTREFAKVFEFSQTSINALERGRSSGKDIIKRVEILLHFPEVAAELLLINSGYLSYEKWRRATEKLRAKEGAPDEGCAFLLGAVAELCGLF